LSCVLEIGPFGGGELPQPRGKDGRPPWKGEHAPRPDTVQSNDPISWSPYWSPIGKRIAFASINGDIYIVGADGTGLVNVTNSPTVLDFGSRDGRTLAFTVGRALLGDLAGNIYTVLVGSASATTTARPSR
jgi:Tol biopolymer transport system component